jgi:RHH-type transcriptional regulator, proline utilization regulon repressor / proline dehydrogenase / delta 1-pyrroline-5-carboxylate dehydrogenase
VRTVVPPEHRVERVARELLRAARPSWRDRVDVNGRLLSWATRRPHFKTGLFRFVDAFPACRTSREVLDHLDEYVLTDDAPAVVRAGLRTANIVPGGAPLAAVVARAGIERMARQFIGGANAEEAVIRVAELWNDGFAATVDLLGEKTLTLADADAYAKRARELLDALVAAAATWPTRPLLEHDPWGVEPRVNVSIKASALAPLLAPATVREGIDEALERLTPLLDRGRDAGVTIHLDTEHDEVKDATFQLLREVGASWPDGPQLGCVVQAYRVDAADDLEALIRWSARTLSIPLQIRLVKGAYWDAEVIKARAMGWLPPVWPEKDETDAAYEALTTTLVSAAGDVRPAFASHNARSIAYALCAAEQAGSARDSIEIQVLHGMATPLHDAVRDRGVRTRVYVPIGELVPGMAYLVRRLLENTSNESFVRHRFTERAAVDELVAPPEPRRVADSRRRSQVGGADGSAPFDNEPHAELRRPEVQARLVHAVDVVERELGFAVPLLVDGRARSTAATIESVDPGRTDVVVCRSASASVEDADDGVRCARDSFEQWAGTRWEDRSGVLLRAAQLMRERRDSLTALEVLEAGKPLAEADADVCEAIDFCEYYAREALRLAAGGPVLDKPGESNRYTYEPRGVGVVIAPWNFPLAIPTGMVTAALVCGNTVVFKPAEQTPGVAFRLVEILLEAGLPPGALAFLPGVGEEIGPPLVEHPEVAFVTFTGSKAVGLDINRRAAVVSPGQRLVKRVVAEMGGKNAVVVDADADLDEAVPAIIQSAFSYAGQKCSAASRVIACEPVADALYERLAGATELVPVGQARDPATVVGPLIDDDAFRRVRDYQARAHHEGRVLVQRMVDCERGWLVGPTLVALEKATSSIARDEIFGPVLALLRAADFDTAIAIANDTEYALTAGCFSRTPSHLAQAGRELRAGNVYLNRGTTGAIVGRQPFGGFGMSGVGSKAGGPDYLHQFVEPRSVSENTVRQGFAPE